MFTGRTSPFSEAEKTFVELLNTEDLDNKIWVDEELRAHGSEVELAVQSAIEQAYSTGCDGGAQAAHLFLQRILYRINRMVLFWYDDLRNYSNERSIYLAKLRDTIEEPWQKWELNHVDPAINSQLTPSQVQDQLRERAAYDVDPELSPAAQYMRSSMGVAGYKHLLAVASVDGLVEASRQSRVCGGAANEVMCAVFRVLMEEYGTGRYAKKHSTFFATMMDELGLCTQPEHYFGLVPWQSLAAMNHNFLLTERRRHYLRYLGGLTFFEVNGPSVYRSYLAAAQNLGLSDAASGYWELHIKEDERHGRQMVDDVALPLVDMYPKDAWEVLLGYVQERMMGERAGAALLEDIKAVDAQAEQ
ncbi:hypothetical protein COCSUDRAFT_57886 [Coccomyxa subellipsoidea C-169]|uniref:Heme oxygenase-like protein n=1 Tax=Coccomyxa subellipsoidea (strain C-169) TaxID=574566 RepID=I0YP40_COCSC|nr:hypothetical protein COCSUDRAFT_57886 [Coccomyxa subellipsoidea C-169]EIE20159.1 hypothetical protein COCSUDRAFT_57886 [Coccomyxa subellipsoidea C-169]|eukprot:XP_005644703.1 hypothetical protein COCSUDRAFT_57886 [Coccomyxa subellipsoidea C-169]